MAGFFLPLLFFESSMTRCSLLVLLIFAFNLTLWADALQPSSTYLHGTLTNGLTYYIRHTEDNNNRVNFYLVEKAGSLNEDRAQSGLAHFLEHMAFNGTRNFPARSIIEILQENGVRFGPDLNAVTSFDKTTFRIENVPAEPGLIDTCLMILKDWSDGLLLQDKEIDAERGVITEEWRTTASLQKRIREKLASQLLPPGHPYAVKTPIGNIGNVNSFHPKALKDFYYKWYRPELQAVIVEGDIEPEKILHILQTLWSESALEEPIPFFITPRVPMISFPKVAIVDDPEIRLASYDIQFIEPYGSHWDGDKRITNEYMRDMVASMIADRLREKVREEDPPFRAPASFNDTYTLATSVPAYSVGASGPFSPSHEPLAAIVYELKRAYDYGFTDEELNRKIEDLKNSLNYSQKLNPRAQKMAPLFTDNFIRGHKIIAQEEKNRILSEFIDTVSINSLNLIAREMIHRNGENTVVILRINSDQKPKSLSRESLLNFYIDAWDIETEPYVTKEMQPKEIKELMTDLPSPGKILAENTTIFPDVTQLDLSNGARVFLWPTDSDIKRISAISKGGYSLMEASDFPQYSQMNYVVTLGGFGGHSAEELQEILAGKQISYNAYVDTLTEGFEGTTSEDPETLMQLLYLRFTSFGQDKEAFENWLQSYRKELQGRRYSPYVAITDSISSTLYGRNNPRMPLQSESLADSINYDSIQHLFAQRFGNAADFDFILTGDFDKEEIKKLIELYLASLPGDPSEPRENFDNTIFPVPKAHRGRFRFSMPMNAPKTSVVHTVNTKKEYNLKNRLVFLILQEILADQYLKDIRESQGGSYNVNVSGDISRIPMNLLTLYISFNTNKEQASGLIDLVNEGLLKIATKGPDEKLIAGIKKNLRQNFISYNKTDDFKVNLIKDYLLYDTLESRDYLDILNNINIEDIQKFAIDLARAPTVIDLITDPE
ncbi:MAG: insulinase family protein [Muribaculaceae bacterium]|nr:insulinase family protein [Muribaculaceae bacterium]